MIKLIDAWTHIRAVRSYIFVDEMVIAKRLILVYQNACKIFEDIR